MMCIDECSQSPALARMYQMVEILAWLLPVDFSTTTRSDNTLHHQTFGLVGISTFRADDHGGSEV